jgi:hypothetical protein
MAVYSGQAPEIMQARQFGGIDAYKDSSYDPNVANASAANAAQSSDTVKTLATVDQAARKTSNS